MRSSSLLALEGSFYPMLAQENTPVHLFTFSHVGPQPDLGFTLSSQRQFRGMSGQTLRDGPHYL